MKCRGKALQAQRGNAPIAVAAAALKQVHLSRDALDKGAAQLAKHVGVVSGSSGKGRVEGSGFISHDPNC